MNAKYQTTKKGNFIAILFTSYSSTSSNCQYLDYRMFFQVLYAAEYEEQTICNSEYSSLGATQRAEKSCNCTYIELYANSFSYTSLIFACRYLHHTETFLIYNHDSSFEMLYTYQNKYFFKKWLN